MCDELIYHGYEGWGRCPRRGVETIHFRTAPPKVVCEEHAREHREREQRNAEQRQSKEGVKP